MFFNTTHLFHYFCTGNVFSSLEGISFDWSLISDTDVDQESIVDAHNIIRHVVHVVLVHVYIYCST